MYAGAALMLLELAAPGFVIFFFGLSACSVGLLRFILGDAFDGTWQLVAFSAFSIIFLALVRRWLKNIFMGSKETSSGDFASDYVGRIGTIVEDVTPPETGRVEIGDAAWTAQSAFPLKSGDKVRITAQKNLTMVVEKI